MSLDALRKLARHSKNVPPALRVVSRAQFTELHPSRGKGYGIKLKGAMPVRVDSVDIDSQAANAVIQAGDIVLQVNGRRVRSAEGAKSILRSQPGRVSLITIPVPKKVAGIGGVGGGGGGTGGGGSKGKMSGSVQRAKLQKTRDLFDRLNTVLANDQDKQSAVLDCMRQYAANQNVGDFSQRLATLLSTPEQRQLVGDIRAFVPQKHRARFDAIIETQPVYDRVTDKISMPHTVEQAEPAKRTVVVQRPVKGSFGFILRGHSPVYIESIDPGSPAEKAGLLPGDYILKLNGLDVRKCTHKHLVMLLHGSGSSPTLDVIHRKPVEGSQLHKSTSMESVASQLSSEWMQAYSTVSSSGRDFRQQIHYLLTDMERLSFRKELHHYNESHNVRHLVESLAPILDTPSKKTLWAYIMPLLSGDHKRYIADTVPIPRSDMDDDVGMEPEDTHRDTATQMTGHPGSPQDWSLSMY
ncbi:PREDICTED: delphilin-like [Priapulus caudatus]|uniref:Delphilin-like n=1 Tax=Priapulus caudatus TaxID=37621 RepID=A0ABM1ELV3_PRICU|nr:PREDICTED: delphilin-like [Priapulus caudatus]